MEREEAAGRTPESSPFAAVDTLDLIPQFHESGYDPAIAEELTRRLLEHAGYTGDPMSEPLVGVDGQSVADKRSGKLLMVGEYLSYAAEHHPYALDGILDFLYTEPGEPEYEAGKKTYGVYVNRSRQSNGKD